MTIAFRDTTLKAQQSLVQLEQTKEFLRLTLRDLNNAKASATGIQAELKLSKNEAAELRQSLASARAETSATAPTPAVQDAASEAIDKIGQS